MHTGPSEPASPPACRGPASHGSTLRGLALLLVVALSLSTGAADSAALASQPSHDYLASSHRFAEPSRRPEHASVARRQLDEPALGSLTDALAASTVPPLTSSPTDGPLPAATTSRHLALAWLLSLPPPPAAAARA